MLAPRSRFACRPLPPLALALAMASLLSLAGAGSAPARAQECEAFGPRPYVCELEVLVARPGERPRPLDPGRRLRLDAGERLDLIVDALDQSGRRFPADRLVVRLEPARRCPRGFVKIEEADAGQFRLESAGGKGECDLLLWVPGNLNLEREIRLEVRSLLAAGYSRGQARRVAEALYRALLDREADPSGLGAAAGEIERGRLAEQVEAMVRSDEFRRERAGLPAAELLTGVYRGLLGRDPDRAGERSYLGEVERGRLAEVVLAIVASEEFEARLLGAAR